MKRLLVIVSLLGLSSSSFAQSVPQWAKEAVWYQIFPERFRNGDPSNDPKASDVGVQNREWHISPWTSDWYELQPWEKKHSSNFYDVVFDRRYGGDIEGIISKLPYLKRLGVNAIYLNPVFESNSLHKYNTANYIHIDHNFGPDPEGDLQTMARENPEDPSTWHWTAADELFLHFLNNAHRLGMRVIIDGVFNHVGTDFWAFKDVVKNQQNSKYKDWFVIKNWDNPATKDTNEFDYGAWWGVKSLPVFGKDTVLGLVHGPREHIFEVTKRWMAPNDVAADGIDGWRLDVPNEIPHPFWKDWRRLVKGIKPDAYIVGEIWDDATPWLQGDEFDAVMNYEFARAVVKFFINDKLWISPTQFDSTLSAVRASYPQDINYVLQNLMDSHDTDRLPSMIINPDRRYDDRNSPRWNPDYSVRKPTPAEVQRQELIALFQMTYLGSPMVYYGDEAGLWGPDDPDDRKPMLWSDLAYEDEKACPLKGCTRPDDRNIFDDSLFAFYSKLIHERVANDALTLGDYKTLLADNGKKVFIFERKSKSDVAIIGFNLSEDDQLVTLDVRGEVGSFWDVLSSQSVEKKGDMLDLKLPKGWGALITNRSE